MRRPRPLAICVEHVSDPQGPADVARAYALVERQAAAGYRPVSAGHRGDLRGTAKATAQTHEEVAR